MIKILLGGSPCTHWSIAKGNGRETKAEGIGWELFLNYVIAKEKFKPDFFLYENNKSAAEAIKQQIQKELGAPLMYIDSALVSAQSRKRFYVFNWQVDQPEDRGILLKDILESALPVCTCQNGKSHTIKAQYGKNGIANFITNGKFNATGIAEPLRVGEYPQQNGEISPHHSKQYRIYSQDGKACTQCGQGGGMGAKTGLYAIPINGCEHDQISLFAPPTQEQRTVGVGYRNRREDDGKLYRRFETSNAEKSNCLTTVQSDAMVAEPITNVNCLGGLYNQSTRWGIYDTDHKAPTLCAAAGMGGGHVPMFPERTIEQPVSDQNPTDKPQAYAVRGGQISIKGKQYPAKLPDGCYIIRKLTPTECERLQTLPDGYTAMVSNAQRYKILGNGWTAEVIKHILNGALKDVPRDEDIVCVSMYDGGGTGRHILAEMGFKNVKYYAYEIDKYAIKVASTNYPDIIQMGDAFQVRNDDWALPE